MGHSYISAVVWPKLGENSGWQVCSKGHWVSLLFVLLLLLSPPPPWAQSENCLSYKSPEMRTSAMVFITRSIKWLPEEGLEQKECSHTHRGTGGLTRGQGRPGHQRWHSTWWSWLVTLSSVFHCAKHKSTAQGRLTLLYRRGQHSPLDTPSATLTQWLTDVLWEF